MQNTNVDISIIIVNYNTKILTKNCIESIIKYTHGVTYEIILVDNASTDGSIEYFSALNNIIFIQSDSNLGFGRANNLGYQSSSGKYILLLNSDTILVNNAIKKFYTAFESLAENIACIGTMLKAADSKTSCMSYGEFPTIQSTIKNICDLYLRRKQIVNYSQDLSIPFPVDYVTGADLCIRRNVIEKYGLFDPDFFMYYEETEMQLRYTKNGFKSMIVPGPHILHLEGASCGLKSKPSQNHRIMYFTGMFTYMRKQYSFIKYILFRIIAIMYLPMVLVAKGNNYWKVIKLFVFSK